MTTTMNSEIINRLRGICIEAVEYVGSVNYPERERSAKREVYRNFELAEAGRLADMKFNPNQWEQD